MSSRVALSDETKKPAKTFVTNKVPPNTYEHINSF